MMPSRPLLLATFILTLAFAAWAMPPQSTVVDGIDEETMQAHFDQTDLQPLEGLWRYPQEDMTLAIERHSGSDGIAYRLLLTSSSDMELLPGTVIGYLAPSAQPSKFTLWLYSERNRITLSKPLECVATFNQDNGTLTFDKPHWNVKTRINFARFLPSLFRGISIIPTKEEEKLPIGFNKIYPRDGNGHKFSRIRYL